MAALPEIQGAMTFAGSGTVELVPCQATFAPWGTRDTDRQFGARNMLFVLRTFSKPMRPGRSIWVKGRASHHFTSMSVRVSPWRWMMRQSSFSRR
jgi:hypothetical protein